MTTRRRQVGGLLLVAGLVVLGLLIWNHTRSLERIHFAGRDYDRGDSESAPSDAVDCGERTINHQHVSVSVPAGDSCSHTIVLWLRAGSGSWAYGLVGGP